MTNVSSAVLSSLSAMVQAAVIHHLNTAPPLYSGFVRSHYQDAFPHPEEELTIPYIRDLAAGPLRDVIPDGSYCVPQHVRSLLHGHPEHYYAGKVNGTSMIELIPDGSVVLMRECVSPRNGRVYSFRIDKEFSLKEFGYDAEKEMHYMAWRDGSGKRIYPNECQTCYCVAEFVAILEEGNVDS